MALPYETQRTEKEIDAVLNAIIDNPGPRWRNMTYEQGVRAALDWITGNEDGGPLDE